MAIAIEETAGSAQQ